MPALTKGTFPIPHTKKVRETHKCSVKRQTCLEKLSVMATTLFVLFTLLSCPFFFTRTALGIKQGPSQYSRSPGWHRHNLIGQGPRQEHSVVAIDGNVYAIAGITYDSDFSIQTTNRVEYYNVPTDSWHVACPLPQPVNHPNAATVDGKIYVLGALSAKATNWTALPSAYFYSPFNDTWSSATPLPNGTARGASAVGMHESTIYLAGGMTYLVPRPGGTQNSLTTVSAYNTATDQWDLSLPPLPEPRQHVGGAVVGHTFFVIGGRENGIGEYRNTTYALDLENPVAWKTMAPMSTARGGVACAALGTKIYCFGGEGNPDNPQRVFNETQAYDVKADSWADLEPMPVPRHGAGVAAVNNMIYYVGGGAKTASFPVGITDSFQPA